MWGICCENALNAVVRSPNVKADTSLHRIAQRTIFLDACACLLLLPCGCSSGGSGSGGNGSDASHGGYVAEAGLSTDGDAATAGPRASDAESPDSNGEDAARGAAIAVGVGSRAACVLTDAGAVECWGDNYYGELGTRAVPNSIDSPAVSNCAYGLNGACSMVPVPVSNLDSGVEALSVGFSAACADVSGMVQCWGLGAVVEPTTPDAVIPVAVAGLSQVSALSVSGDNACAVMAGGAIQCWANDVYVVGGVAHTWAGKVYASGAKAVSVGDTAACALTTAGGLQCWGDNRLGLLGNGTQTGSTVPVQVMGLTAGATAVSVGTRSACAVTSSGGVQCWGSNDTGELGNATTTSSTTPVDVAGLSSGATAVAVGDGAACAVVSGGVQCWGALLGWAGLDASAPATCTPVSSTGSPSGTKVPCSLAPGAVTGLAAVTAVSLGASSACVLTATGVVECWGDNSFGQLGDGLLTSSTTPVTVGGL